MADNSRGEILWYAPDPRGILPLDERFHIPHGLRRTLKKHPFTITFDQEFEEVILQCSKVHGETWISGEIIRAYTELHTLGFAHSVEARQEGVLVGGLYGVHIRGAFFGESMFHHETDASKCALVALVEHLRDRGFRLLDTQWTTPHLEQFGAIEISRKEYLRLLEGALEQDCRF